MPTIRDHLIAQLDQNKDAKDLLNAQRFRKHEVMQNVPPSNRALHKMSKVQWGKKKRG